MLFMVLFIYGGLTTASQFIEYLRKQHAERFKAMSSRSFSGVSADDHRTPLINPILLFKFLFSHDAGDDIVLQRHIQRVRIMLIAYFVLSLFAALVVD
jgi:hypothetical protein